MHDDVFHRRRYGCDPLKSANRWREKSFTTAAKPRRRTGRLESLEARQLLVADLVISEFMASPTNAPGNIQDKDGDFSDWIEIHNTTAAPINLAGWSLTDKSNDLDQWVFPSQTLAANGYLVVFASEKDLRAPGQELHTNFKLGGGGEYLALVAPDGLTFGSQFTPEYPDQFNNISYGPNSAYTANGYFTTPSPGQPNTTEPVADPTRRIVINEIMYHPQTENDQHEFIELVNRGTQMVNLTGWQFTAGVDYTFGNVSLAPNQFLVVAANTGAFTTRYGAVANLVGGWTGSLSNTAETIRLRDNLGSTIDEVDYADQGDWGTRIEVNIGGNSWEWESLSDGSGRSLELRNWQLTNNNGQNWGPSNANNGTPGVQNSINSANLAPLIDDVDQSVAVPSTTTAVTITADITDESATGLTVNLRWRIGTGVFNTSQMFDDGAHGDGVAGDGEYGATIAAQSVDGTIVEYYVEARDGSNQTRTWPAPGRRTTGTTEQVVNAQYRVDNTLAGAATNAWTPGSEPIFVMVMTAAEYSRFSSLSTGSDAQAHGSFFVIDGTGVSGVHHSASVRVRGASSRGFNPPPLRMELPHDNPWHGFTDFNLNSKYPELQLLGSAVMREAGLLAAAGTQIQFRVNGVNGAHGSQPPQLGSYLWLEPYNSEFLDQHVPNDSGGNVYKKVRPITNWPSRNGNAGQYMSDGWSKSTNASENNWSDLDNLFNTLHQTPPGAGYYNAVNAIIDVDQWVRWFAAMELLNSRETNLSNGADDDFQMYRGVVDPRFQLLPHDLDTILGQGDSFSSPNDPFFQAIIPDGEYMPVLENFFNDPVIQRKYYLAIKDLAETTFSATRMAEIIDQVLGGYVSQGQRDSMKSYAAQRAAHALNSLPPGLTPDPPPPNPVDPIVPVTSDLIVNEVLAYNTTASHGATFPDKIELFNRGASSINLTGMSISDNVDVKAKYVFPAGTTLGPGQYLTLYADSAVVAGEHHLGFALDRTGDGVYLFNTVAAGQTLLDSVEFGQQIANFSIGRMGPDRQWTLTQPTFGAANVAQTTGSASTLKINEWFANGDIRFEEDYVELYNPAAQPVALAGVYITDEAVGAPQQYKIPALSYIAADGYAVFTADGETGHSHLPFQLSADFDHLGLFARNGVIIDQILYKPQTTDYSQGRNPNGSATRTFMRVPTPDVANPAIATPQTINLMPISATWRYNQSATNGLDNLPIPWYATSYNDTVAGWSSGQGVIAQETQADLPADAIIRTPLTIGMWTYYFRGHFTLNASPASTTVTFSALVDDGAVFYVNGQEVPNTRIRMPSGAFNFQTPGGAVTNTTWSTPITIPTSMLQQGDNLIAVEVHQSTQQSGDVVMGMRVDATLPPPDDITAPLTKLFDGLRVTEIMYNPLGGTQFEYIELQNISGQSLDLTGVRLSDAVDFTFPNMSLAAGARTVVVANVAAFQSRYGNAINVAGQFTGDLGNGGEDVVLQLPAPYDAGILRFDYNDTWYPNTDGAGYSLVVNNTATAARDWDQKATWRASGAIFGSPGGVDVTPASLNGQILDDLNANGVQNAGDLGHAGVAVSLYSAGADGIFGGTGDTLIGTINTSPTGDYSFSGLAPGAYYLSVVMPAGTGFSPMDQGGNDALDSDFDPPTKRTGVFTLAAGQNDTSRDGLLSTAVAPTVDIVDVAPDPRATSVDTITIAFDQAVSGFDLADLSLTRGGGANLFTGAQTLTTTDNITWTLGNLAGLTTTGGDYTLTLNAAGAGITSAASGIALVSGASDSFTVQSATIAGRRVFYNQSKFDVNDATANANDDAAIATDKVALLPGGTASFANYTSFNRGLNGIMVDIANLPAGAVLSASDFDFKVGNTDTPSAWAALAAAPTVSVRPAPGAPGTSRVTLIWPTGAAIKQWLQVTVKANGNTGLTNPDVFYFGNAVGESGNVAGDYSVSITDELLARNNPVGIIPGTTVINRFDYNRDGTVSVVDQLLSRNNITTVSTRLRQITVPSALSGSGLVAQGLDDSDIARGLAASSPAGSSSTSGGSSFGGSTSGSTSSSSRLQPQALSAAYGEGESLLGKRRTAPAANVDDELLALLHAGR